MISSWVTAMLFAMLLTVVPFTSVLRLLAQLPPAIALSHRRWPASANALVVSVVAAAIAVFVRTSYLGVPQPTARVAITFVIAVLVYAFGLVLLLRQFCGVYADYIITVKPPGLILRKTSYSTIENVERVSEIAGEARFRILTSRGTEVFLTLPARDGEAFYAQIRKKLDGG
jgi:hypothetical protein